MKNKMNITFFLCFFAMFLLIGCNRGSVEQGDVTENKSQTMETSSLREDENQTIENDNEIVAIHAGDAKIYLDEVRYYAYKTQATYEVYYMSQNKKLDWDHTLASGVTLKEGVKSEILDGICKRQALYEYAQKSEIALTDENRIQVEKQVENYLTNSNEKMLDKVKISRERLTEIYEKEMIADIVMQSKKDDEIDEIYVQWKNENVVTTENVWDDITFDEKIIVEN